MPKKREEEEAFEEVWDKKKIAAGIAVITLLVTGLYFTKMFFYPSLPLPTSIRLPQQSVAGISTGGNGQVSSTTHASFTPPTQQDVQAKMQEIKEQVTHLSLHDIASSSPQVQQVLQELQQLPQTPANMAKSACIQLCNKL